MKNKLLNDIIRLRLVSADTAELVKKAIVLGMELNQVTFIDELTIEATLSRKSYKLFVSLAEKNGAKLDIVWVHSVYLSLRRLFKRPLLITGILLYLFLCIYVPSRIFFVYVEGNHSLTTQCIIAEAEKVGVQFGASRSTIRSETVKNALLSALPQLRWAGVRMQGCVAVITVREKESLPVQIENSAAYIIAKSDGVITEATLFKGNLLCKVGQGIREGDILASGYTDFGVYTQYGGVDAEIYADTLREIKAIMPVTQVARGSLAKLDRKFSIIIGKNRIKLYNGSGISDTGCVKMYTEVPLALPGGFCLPLAIGMETIFHYPLEEITLPEETVSEIISREVESYLQSVMVGGKILSGDTQIEMRGKLAILSAEFYCNEMIGQYYR
ncbi:MAG: sporulation protein YqfD [Oscillospiraceae bacterium]|nr:sporulation protein YqfD [Oscillospiraceae bacterium]